MIEITALVSWNKMPDPQHSHYLLLERHGLWVNLLNQRKSRHLIEINLRLN